MSVFIPALRFRGKKNPIPKRGTGCLVMQKAGLMATCRMKWSLQPADCYCLLVSI